MSAAFSVQVTGTAPLVYQWRRDGTAIAGATDSSYVVSATLADNGAQFSVVVSNTAGTATSNNALLTVKAVPVAPTIVTQPASKFADAGKSVTLEVAAAGSAPLAYQWYRNGTAVAGANAASLTINPVSWDHYRDSYTVTVSNPVDQAGVTSQPARLTVLPDTDGLLCQASGWCWVQPRPSGLSYRSVSFVSNVAVAATQAGTLHRSTDAGANWSSTTHPLTPTPTYPFTSALTKVRFSSGTHGLAGGPDRLLRTTDGGLNWNAVPIAVTGLTVTDIAYANATTAVVVTNSTRAFRTTDTGETWTELTLSTGSGVGQLEFSSSGIGIIIAYTGAVLRSTDNGATWTQVATLPAVTYSLAFSTSTDAVAIGDDRSVFRTANAGQTWSQLGSLTSTAQPRAVAFQNENVGIAVGTDASVWRTSNGGVTWQLVRSEATQALPDSFDDVAVLSDGRAIIVGSRGRLLRSTDGGLTWTEDPGLPRRDLRAVAFADERYGAAVGLGGTIRSTNDGGRTWVTVPLINPSAVLWGVAFASETTGVAVGNSTAYRSTDRGQSWTPINFGQVGFIGAITFLSSTVGLVVGGDISTPLMLRTADAGLTWTPVAHGFSETFYFVSRISDTRAIAGGANGAIITNDGGLTWVPVPALSANSLTTYAVFGDAQRGVATRGLQFFFTSDGGATWTENTQHPGLVVEAAAMSRDRLLLAVRNNPLFNLNKIYGSFNGGATIAEMEPYMGQITGMAFLPNGAAVAVGPDNTVAIKKAAP